jgi:hypothetical protein
MAVKPDVKKPHRDALVKAGFLDVEHRKTEKGGKAIWLEVSDNGWAWAEENLAAALPSQSTAGALILQAWLERLQAFMSAKKISLAEIIAPSIGNGFAAEEAPTAPSPYNNYSTLRDRIRSAYKSLAGNTFNRRVLLRDLRSHLSDISRPELDETLLRISREDDATLISLDNQREITSADRDAAIQIGEEQRHILWISQ